MAKPMPVIEFATDNKSVGKMYNAGPIACPRSINCDLYTSIFRRTIDKAIRLTARWMPSHLGANDPLPGGITQQDLKGNRLADLLAGEVATKFALPLRAT